MTAPYYPGTQPGQPQQPMYPAPIYTQQPGFAPAPAPQYGAPAPQYQQPPQQSQQPAYGAPPQLPQQYQGADLNARLAGPGIPPELQGRTVAEGLRYYGIMREEFARQRQQQGQPLQGQPSQQPAQPQQPAPQFSAQPRVPGQPGQPGQPDPMRQYITEGLREVLPEMLAPLTAPITQRQVQETYGAVRSRYPDWAQYEGDIMQSLQGANAAQLSNPDVLEAAYFYAKGRGVTRGQQQPQGQPAYQPGWPQQPPQGFAPPMPQQYSGMAPAFVEGPTPPLPTSYGQNGQPNDPRDELFARRFNVPVEVYRSWKLGQGQQDRVGMLKAPQPGIGPQQGNGQPGQQQPAQPQWPGYPPQQFLPPGQYQQPSPPGFYQPSPNGGGYGY